MLYQDKYFKYKEKYLNLKNTIEYSGGGKNNKKNSKKSKKNSKISRINNKNNKYIIGIAGASGCGKTYFSEYLKKLLIDKNISTEIVSCDDYYKSYSEKKNASGKYITPVENGDPTFNWDVPEVFDLKLLNNDLIDFNDNKNIKIPDFDFIELHRKEKPKKIIKSSEVQVLIVEGLFVLYDEDVRSQLNLKIFIDSDSEICLARRIFRDIVEGRQVKEDATLEDKNKYFLRTIKTYKKNVQPAYLQYIEPTKAHADLIINSEIDYTNTDTKTVNFILDEIQTYFKV